MPQSWRLPELAVVMHLHAVRLARGDQRVTVEMRGLTNWSVINHSKEVLIDLEVIRNAKPMLRQKVDAVASAMILRDGQCDAPVPSVFRYRCPCSVTASDCFKSAPMHRSR